MSGTSCDGVDAALVDIAGSGEDMRVEYVEHCGSPYSEVLQNELLAVMAPAKTRTETIARLNYQVGKAFANGARKLMDQARISPADITAIGSHGQTICHMPAEDDEGGFTLQIGEPAIIAAHTAIDVVADFRAADLAVGGQGAPLVPWTDHILLGDPDRDRIVQNIGGIANLTYLPAGGTAQQIIAFDTGPGCMVIDALIRRFSHKERSFDPQGRYAARGQPDTDTVDKMMQLPYFQQPPPKSAGREQFGRPFLSGMRHMLSGLSIDKYDMVATATLLTARSIAHAYRNHLPFDPRRCEVILTGGGARNKTLIQMLAEELPDTRIRTVDDLGIPLQAKECVSFAVLAAAFLDKVPANLPQVTGASRAVVLGKLIRAL